MTLTQVAVLTKQIITLIIIVISVGIVGFIGYRIWYANYLASLPPIEEKPDTKFGLLPQIDFPASLVSSSNFSYSIDTSTGNLPKVGQDASFEKLVKVYFVTKTLTTLLSAEKSHALAGKLGITNAPEILSDTKYRYRNDGRALTIDLDNSNFTFDNTSVTQSEENIDDDKISRLEVATGEIILYTLSKDGKTINKERVVFMEGRRVESGKIEFGFPGRSYYFNLYDYLDSLKNKGISYTIVKNKYGWTSVHITLSKK